MKKTVIEKLKEDFTLEKLKVLIGTGFAQPKWNKSIQSVPIKSRWWIGFKLNLPCLTGVSSPNLYKISYSPTLLVSRLCSIETPSFKLTSSELYASYPGSLKSFPWYNVIFSSPNKFSEIDLESSVLPTPTRT